MTPLLLCLAPVVVTDGDSLKCADGVKLRVSMADAADYRHSGRCRPRPKRGAWCDDIMAERAKQNMRRLIAGRTVKYAIRDANPCRKGFQRDPYAYRGRVVAVVYADGVSLGPAQIKAGLAKRWRCER